MKFTDVRVPEENLVGSEGDGMSFSHAWFRYERLMIAARCCGAAERLIEEATAFAEERQAYGAPIADYQAIQFMLADSLTELWAARLMTYETARAIDAGADLKVQHAQCSMAKLYASEMAEPGSRPGGADLRWAGVHAGERRRALLPGATSRSASGRGPPRSNGSSSPPNSGSEGPARYSAEEAAAVPINSSRTCWSTSSSRLM